MKNTSLFNPIRFLACVSILALGSAAQAQITGNLNTSSVNYGSPLALQTITTGFGDSGGNDSGAGSELDGAYGVIQNGNLDLFLAGNIQNNGNHLNIFVAGGAPGQSILNAPATATLQTMNGSVFSPGFQATYAYDVNDYAGTLYSEEYTYAGPGALSGGYVGSVAEYATGLAGPAVPGGGGFPAYATIAINNNNVSTMTGSGSAYNASLAAAVRTGFEMSIPLSQIGYTGGPVEVLADINGGGDGYLSNQFLAGLPVGTGNLGTAAFNFGSTPGEYFVVPVPEPSSLAILGISGLGALMMFRRRK
jgi:hypothetical protein